MARLRCARWEPIPCNFTPGGIGPVWWYLPHVAVGLGDVRGLFSNPATQASTHGEVLKDGTIVQYVDTDNRAWAEVAGNRYAISFESEGYDYEPHTPAQIEGHAHVLAELHPLYPAIRLAVTDSVVVPGVGTHRMGGAAWGGHSCPGDARAAQRPQILGRTLELLGGNVEPVTFPNGPWLVATAFSTDAEAGQASLDLSKRYRPSRQYQGPAPGFPNGFWTNSLSVVEIDPSRPNDWPIPPGSLTVGLLLVHDGTGRWVRSTDPFHDPRPPAFGAIVGADGVDTAHRVAALFGV